MVFESLSNLDFIEYIVIFVLLILAELIYIPVARYFKIGSVVTPRSSHNEFKVSGGGIIFYIATILFYLFYPGKIPPLYSTLILGATILAFISFFDDIKNIAAWLRLVIHIAVVIMLYQSLFINGYYDVFLLVLICGVGFINAYNFMDGINGLLAGYSLVTLSTLLYCYQSLYNIVNANFYVEFIIILIGAVVIFSFLNFRKNALCFSGDVGAIVMGYLILFLFAELILSTSEASIVIFLIVYAIDSVFTIFQRLFAGENIFQSHRLHLYQILANQRGIAHYKIAITYSLIQLLINIGYILISSDLKWTYFISVITILTIIYFMIKRHLVK